MRILTARWPGLALVLSLSSMMWLPPSSLIQPMWISRPAYRRWPWEKLTCNVIWEKNHNSWSAIYFTYCIERKLLSNKESKFIEGAACGMNKEIANSVQEPTLRFLLKTRNCCCPTDADFYLLRRAPAFDCLRNNQTIKYYHKLQKKSIKKNPKRQKKYPNVQKIITHQNLPKPT